MRVKTVTVAFVLLLLFFKPGFADLEFYQNILKDGKTKYQAGKFNEALQDFKIAEFGLKQQQGFLNEIYQYMALAFFKSGKLTEAREVLAKYRAEFNLRSLESSNIPSNLKIDFSVMTIILRRSSFAELTPGLRREIRYETAYLMALELLDNENFEKLKESLKTLQSIDKKDPRTELVSLIIQFYAEKKYARFIKKTEKITPNIKDGKTLDRAFYLLALSQYYLKKYKKVLALIQKIRQPAIRQRLQRIIQESEAGIKSNNR